MGTGPFIVLRLLLGYWVQEIIRVPDDSKITPLK
jgi:hypothetical protein